MTDHATRIKQLLSPTMPVAQRQRVGEHADALAAERDALLAYAEELEVIINNEVDFGEIVVFNERTRHKVAHLLREQRA